MSEPVAPGRRFRFRVELVDGYWQVQDTENDNKSCFRTTDEALARQQAAHCQPYINGKRIEYQQSTSTRHS